MSKLMMGFQIFLMFAFFMSAKVEANQLNACMKYIDFGNGFDSLLKLGVEEQFNVSCVNVTLYLNCVNDVLRNQTGFDVKQLAFLMQGTEIGKVFTMIINMTDLVQELCTEGTQLREDYFEHSECYRDIDMNVLKECQSQAVNASTNLRHLLPEGSGGRQSLEENCITTAIKVGCIGAAIHEECGDQAFDVYKRMVRKMGFFQSGLCPSGLMQTLKTTFLDSLNMLESRKTLYRVIMDLKRRRK